jgi:hypothetical protein
MMPQDRTAAANCRSRVRRRRARGICYRGAMPADKELFRHSVKRLDPGIVLVEVHGYMDTGSSASYLPELKRVIDDVRVRDHGPVGLLFKDELSGFDTGTAAKAHGMFFRQMGEHVHSVAIVSSKLRMRFGVAGAKLFAKQPIELFASERDALTWLTRQKPPAARS